MEGTETLQWRRDTTRDKLLPGPGLLVSRGVVYLALLFVLAAALWSSITRLDVVVNARGRLVVQGKPIAITAPEAALVVDVPVRIGQEVRAGDVLLQLDAFAHRSEARRIEADMATLRAEASRHREAARAIAATSASVLAELEALTTVAGLVRGELESLRALANDGIASATDVKVAEQKLAEAQARLARVRAELQRNERDTAERERLARETERKIGALEVRSSQLREYEKRSTIRAPVAATVTHLAVMHPGSVIGTSEPAVVLAPEGQPLFAAVEVPNASMRRLRNGLTARLAFDAFPQEDFGYVEGRLIDIEPDADNAGNYTAWVSLEREEVAGSSLLGCLKPGFLAEARIVVERRRVADFLLRPLRRLGGLTSVEE